MPTADPLPAAKPDNLFGICHALGEAFGFNPLYLRLALTIGALASFEGAIIAYAIGGVAVLAGALVHRLGRRTVSSRPIVPAAAPRQLVEA